MLSLLLAAAGSVVAPGGSHLPAANVAEACQWPTVVAFRTGRDKCTGVLVEPRHVLTAAHCLRGGNPDRVRFGESFQPYARAVDVDSCLVDPAFADSDAPGDDLAACRLVEPVLDVPPTPVLAGCAAEAVLQPGTDVALVGFGIPDTDGLFGDKRYAFTRVAEALRDDDTFVAGDDEVGGCDGDSGGPAFVRLPDGTWHVAGILVAGPACGEGASRYLAPSRRLEWLEQQLGVALGPCGQAGCGVATDPLAVADAWDEGCRGPTRTPRDGCEPPTAGSSGGEGTTSGDVPPLDPASSSSPDDHADEAPASGAGCRVGGAHPLLLLSIAGLTRRPRRGRGRSAFRRDAARRARAPAPSPASSTRSPG